MKKVLILMLVTAMILGMTACASSTPAAVDTSKSAAGTVVNETKTEADTGKYGYITSTDKFEINVASVMNDGVNEVAAEHFKKVIEEATNGNITVNLYLAGTSGTETENLNQVATGELEIAIGGSNYATQILGDWNATGIPFLFTNYEDVEVFWDTYWDEMEAVSLASGIRCLGLMRRGARDLTCNTMVAHPENVKGMVLRLPDNAIWQMVWESLGAVCTPVSMQEVYTALQTGVVDAQENPIGTTYANNLQEVCKYNILTHHLVQHFVWLINDKFYQNLPDDYQRLIAETIQEECDWAADASEKVESDYTAKAKEGGMEFIEVNADEFRAAARDGILSAASTMNKETQAYVEKVLGD